ncbi:hypothetical protein [Sediminivirga luteola]|uniref:hypothetical protein n=1 Tax=Sediminivirga luteola TaxID=1774748 RepID=UPI001F56FBFC|nr:hypothetical protein [Sediminivirga luteola]MCI2266678.1 hypothetical protein [Sediminivirga luteola]
MSDPATIGDDSAIDDDEDPGRWLLLEHTGSHAAWEDMAAFARRHWHDTELQARMERAIEGKGAFRAFRTLLRNEGLPDTWEIFSTDRQIGRARQLLAANGIVVTHQAT